jgi:lipopolysaccharide transport system ATP-binding protein
MSAVENLCSRGVYMKHGTLVSTGNVPGIIDQYLNDNKQRLSMPLAQRQDRKGNHLFMFEKLEIGNSDLSKTFETIKTGQSAVIRLYFKMIPDQLSRMQIDIGVNNDRDVRITWLSTSLSSSKELNLASDKNFIDFNLPVVQLVPGNYSLTLFASCGGEVADWIPDAFSFTVEQGDFYNTGKLPPSSQGFFLTQHTFNY